MGVWAIKFSSQNGGHGTCAVAPSVMIKWWRAGEGTIFSLTHSAGLFSDHFFFTGRRVQFYLVLSTLLPGRPEKKEANNTSWIRLAIFVCDQITRNRLCWTVQAEYFFVGIRGNLDWKIYFWSVSCSVISFCPRQKQKQNKKITALKADE